jgi:hypothetical protein
MIGIFAGGDLRQQSGTGQSLVEDGDRHMADRDMVMTLRTCVLEADMLAHEQAGGDEIELLADVLAKLLADHAAARANAFRFGKRVLGARTRQILGQRLAAVSLGLGFFRRSLVVGCVRRGGIGCRVSVGGSWGHLGK